MKRLDRYTENIMVSSGRYEQEKAFWSDALKGCSGFTELIPDDPAEGAYNGERTVYSYQFPKPLAAKLSDLCGQSDYGIFVIMLTGVLYVLHRLNGTEDLLVGVPVLREDAERECSNAMLPLRFRLDPAKPLKIHAGAVQTALGSLYRNGIYPLYGLYGELGLALSRGEPAFRTVVQMESLHDSAAPADDESGLAFGFARRGSGLFLHLSYREQDYREESVKRVIRLLTDFLQAVLEDPGLPFTELNVISEEEAGAFRSRARRLPSKQEEGAHGETPQALGEAFVPPRNALEEELAGYWREVLGVETVGVADNFFHLGGDSIKAIRLAALLWQYGVRIRDLYVYPTISELAGTIEAAEHRSIDQQPVTGEARLTQIQRWFFELGLAHPSHYNQSLFLFRKEGFDPALLQELFEAIVKHHDALRMTFTTENGAVKAFYHGIEGVRSDIAVADLRREADVTARVRELADQAHAAMDMAREPLMKWVLFHTPEGDHLLMIVHHLVVDGISWRILLEDFSRGYTRLLAGEPAAFPPKTDSYRDWAARLEEYAASPELQEEAAYWSGLLASAPSSLPGKKRHHDGQSRGAFSISLSVSETAGLKQLSNRLNLSVDSILLAAIGSSVRDWKGLSAIIADVEGHGRQDILDDININRTVGWFTSLYPVLLQADTGDFTESAHSVNRMLRNVPNKGFGYSILKHLTRIWPLEGEAGSRPDICFNYLGEFDQDIDTGLFTLSRLPSGRAVAEDAVHPYSLEINSIIVEEKLQVNISYDGGRYDPQEISAFAAACKRYVLRAEADEGRKEEAYRQLARQSRLPDIQPFNEVYYKDCFFNAFFAIARYFGKETDPFFANDTAVFTAYDGEDPLKLDMEYVPSKPMIGLAEEHGIVMQATVVCSDIVRELKWAVACGKPAVVRVDCFYESARQDTYQKKHWPHTLLVFGYNDDEEAFDIMEHSDINNLDYRPRTIRYAELQACYSGLLEHFQVGEDYPTFFEFSLKDGGQQPPGAVSLAYAQNVLAHKELIMERLEGVRLFGDALGHAVTDEARLAETVNLLVLSVHNVLKAKYVEGYRNRLLFKESGMAPDTLQEIVQSWKLIKNVLDKYLLTRRYKEASFLSVTEAVRLLYDLERRYAGELFDYLESVKDS